MRTLAILVLWISLAANATLAYLLFATREGAVTASATSTVVATQPKGMVTAATWAQLSSEGEAGLVKRLQAAGFPRDMIRAILRARIAEQYESRMKALVERSTNRPFWKGEVFDPEMLKAMQEITREQTEALKRLMPEDAQERAEAAAKRFAYLSPEKAGQLDDLLAKFSERRTAMAVEQIYDRTKRQALEKEEHAAIAALLSPDELFEYDVRNSRSASSLRGDRLGAFDATEEEFRAIFRLRQAFDEKYDMGGMFPGGDDSERRQRVEAERQLALQIKATLTPDRAAAYERMTDFNYAQTAKLVSRLQLPAQTTDALYDLTKEFQQRQRDLYQSGAVTSREDMVAKGKVLQDEAVAKATQILGSASAVDAYRQCGGQWIGYLVPSSARGK